MEIRSVRETVEHSHKKDGVTIDLNFENGEIDYWSDSDSSVGPKSSRL